MITIFNVFINEVELHESREVMKFEVLKKNNLKRNIIIGGCVVLIISAVILNFSSARYRSTASVPIVDSEVNYVRPDLNIVAIVVDGVSTNTMPEGNYKLLDTSYCTINGEDANVTLSWDQTTQMLTVTPFTTRGTKCYLYFDELIGFTISQMLAGYTKSTRTDFSTTVTSTTTGAIYESADTTQYDNDGEVYYFAGNPTDNYVYFAGFYWRIIRINGDESIRLIYQGTTADGNGQITTSAYNSSSNINEYVGFMYTVGSVHGSGTSSTIKEELDKWYEDNLLSYENNIDTNAGFCNDRTPSTSTSSSNGEGGTGTTWTYYGAYIRLENDSPTFKCSNESDLFTSLLSNKGNKSLKYPIGLITADEVVFAGGMLGVSNVNQSYYLYAGEDYWTMSPSYFGAPVSYAPFVIYVNSSGRLSLESVYNVYSVRPVINLKANTLFTGSGTNSDPFTVVS